MTTITFKAPMNISAASNVEEFNKDIRDNLDGETTELVGGTFTVRVADADVVQVKRLAKASGFALVSAEQD